MKNIIKIAIMVLVCMLAFSFEINVFADESTENITYASEESVPATQESESKTVNVKAVAAAAMIALVASIGAIAMAIAIAKGSDGIAKQPEAASNIRTNVMLGLVFIETAIIYALIVAILIIFVL